MIDQSFPNEQEIARSGELTQLFFERSVTSEEKDELLDLWSRYPVLKTNSIEEYEIEQDLHFLGNGSRSLLRYHTEAEHYFSSQVAEREATRQAKQHENGLKKNVAAKTSAKKNKKSLPFGLLVSVIGILFIIGIYSEFRQPRPKETIRETSKGFASVRSTIDVQWNDDASIFKPNSRLDKDRLVLKSGVVEIELDNGSRLVLEGPADFQLDDIQKAFCHQGRISATITPEGSGFVVDTPFFSVRDIGTEFVLDVSEDKAEVHVISGQVETNRLASDWIPLPQDRGLSFDRMGESQKIVADRRLFMSSKVLADKTKVHQERQREFKNEFERKLTGDNSLQLWIDFSDEERSIFSNRATAAKNNVSVRSFGTASPIDSNTGTKAIEFRRTSDRIEINGLEKCRSMTLIVRAKLKHLQHASNVLLASRDYEETSGGFLWQIDRFGRMQFHVRRPGDQSADTFDSPPCILGKDLNTWTVFALVLDFESETLIHYIDGRVAASFPFDAMDELHLDRLLLGNLPAMRKNDTARFFPGLYDKLLIFSRALSETEITEFSDDRAGKR